MLAPEFPEDLAAYDSAGNYLGDIDRRNPRPETFQSLAPEDNRTLDIKIVQSDRAETMPGYRLVTFDEMEVEPPAKQWLIKDIFARGETSAWIAPPGAMKSALLAEAAIWIGVSGDTIDLTHPEAFKKVIDTIRTAKTILGADMGLVIIDTPS